MSHDKPPPPSGQPQSINPYAPSRVPDGELKPAELALPTERHYQARLTWADRRALLRSIGPVRLGVVASWLIWLHIVYVYVTEWAAFLWTVGLSDLETAVRFASAAFLVGQGFLVFYACHVEWKYAEALRLVAGGTTADMRSWSSLHWRTSWLWAVIATITLAATVSYWLIEKIFPP